MNNHVTLQSFKSQNLASIGKGCRDTQAGAETRTANLESSL